jgi:hypothetical protein
LRRFGPFSQPQALLIAFIAFMFIYVKKFHHKRLQTAVSMVAFVAIVLTMCDGCGGAGTAPPPIVGTPAGAYSLIVTATGNGNVTATTTINLTVN